MPSDPNPLVEHWDGTSWTIVFSTRIGALNSVSARTGSDVWAVGNSGNSREAVAVHWDGHYWDFTKPVSLGSTNRTGVIQLSHGNVWATGYHYSTTGAIARLIEHYNGHSWTVIQPQTGVRWHHYSWVGQGAMGRWLREV